MAEAKKKKKKAFPKTYDGLMKLMGELNVTQIVQHTPIKKLSTGILPIDWRTGGFPMGRMTEIYGSPNSGKCVVADTHIMSEYGMMTIDELFRHEGYNPSCTSRVLPHQVRLLNENGDMESTSHLTWNNRKPVNTITTREGFTIKATDRHPIRVMNESGYIVWKHAKDIKLGDYVVMMRGHNIYPDTDQITIEEARFLGYLIADGSLSQTARVGFTNSDPEIIRDYSHLCESIFHDVPKIYKKEGSEVLEFHLRKHARDTLYNKYGLDYTKAAGKTVPLCVRMSSYDIQKAFIRGYFELESYVDGEQSEIEVASASHKLLHQVQLMLLNMGIMSRVSYKQVNGEDYWRLTICGESYDKYINCIGYWTKARQQQINKNGRWERRIPKRDTIPHINALLRSLYDASDTDRSISHAFSGYIGKEKKRPNWTRLTEIWDMISDRIPVHMTYLWEYLHSLANESKFFAEVMDIKRTKEPTFDVVMPQTHSFWSNGFISHNTTLGLLAMKEMIHYAQANDKRIFFFDQERGLDYSWAVRLGLPFRYNAMTESYDCTALDKDGMPIIDIFQAETAEQAMEGLKVLIKSKRYCYGVVDSAAKLVPKAALEATMDKGVQIGLHARLMTIFVNQISGMLANTDLALVILNHVRDDIGNPYNKYISPGGRAFHHDIALRLETYNQKEHWVEGSNYTLHDKIEFRYYVRKTKVSDSIGSMVSYFLHRRDDSDEYYINVVEDMFTMMHEFDMIQNVEGKKWSGRGNGYFPAEDYGYTQPDPLIKPNNDLGSLWIGQNKAGILEFIKANSDVYFAMEKAFLRYTTLDHMKPD
jgi:RecA/RadA recombinase